jgi:hypothetical protein
LCVSQDESCRKHVSSPDGFTMKIRPDGTYPPARTAHAKALGRPSTSEYRRVPQKHAGLRGSSRGIRAHPGSTGGVPGGVRREYPEKGPDGGRQPREGGCEYSP